MKDFYNNIKDNVKSLNITQPLINKNVRTQNEWREVFRKNPELSKEMYIKYFEFIFSDNKPINGIWLEFGVWSGKTINILSKYADKIYGFDSFIGLPTPATDNRTDWRQTHFDRKGVLPKVNNNVKLIKGWFNDTLKNFLDNNNNNVSVLHIDSDLYSSAKYVLNTLKHLLVNGTIVIFDELINYSGFKEGELLALYEFCQENPEYNFRPLYVWDNVADYNDKDLNKPQKDLTKTGLPFKPFYCTKCCFVIEIKSTV